MDVAEWDAMWVRLFLRAPSKYRSDEGGARMATQTVPTCL